MNYTETALVNYQGGNIQRLIVVIKEELSRRSLMSGCQKI